MNFLAIVSGMGVALRGVSRIGATAIRGAARIGASTLRNAVRGALSRGPKTAGDFRAADEAIQGVLNASRRSPRSALARIIEIVLDKQHTEPGGRDELRENTTDTSDKEADYIYKLHRSGRQLFTRVWMTRLEKAIERTRSAMANDALHLRNGRITLDQFSDNMRQHITALYTAAGVLGAGGFGNVSPEVLSRIDKKIHQQFMYLDRFIADVNQRMVTGQSITPADIRRAGSYANSARDTFWTTRQQVLVDQFGTEVIEEKRIRTASESCPDCVEFAGLPWSPIGTLPSIGDSQCKSNCRCYFAYRQRKEAAGVVHSQGDDD